MDHLKLLFLDENILFGENVIINKFSRFNSCEVFQNTTLEQLTALKTLNVSELGSPNNSSNLWHTIDVDFKHLGGSCENFTSEFFFNFEFARSQVDNIPHQNLIKRVSVNTGLPGQIKVSRNRRGEYGVYIRIGVMFYDLTDISYSNSGKSDHRPLFWVLSFFISFILMFFK